MFKDEGITLRVAYGKKVTSLGRCTISLSINGLRQPVEFIVFPSRNPSIILGWDFLEATNAVIDCGRAEIRLEEAKDYLNSLATEDRIVASENMIIPAESIKQIYVMSSELNGRIKVLFEPSKCALLIKELSVPYTLLTINHNKGQLWIANSSPIAQIIPKGMFLGRIQVLDVNHLTAISECSDPEENLARDISPKNDNKGDVAFLQNLISNDSSADLLTEVLSIVKKLIRIRKLIEESGDEPREYELVKGTLYKRNFDPLGNPHLFVIPKHLRLELLRSLHDAPTASHLEFSETHERVRNKYLWPGLLKDIRKYEAHCKECQRIKQTNHKPPGLLKAIPPAAFPFQRIRIDLLGRFPNGNKCIIVCTDYLTRFAVTKALPTGEEKEAAKFLMEYVVLKHGAPREIITDRGRVVGALENSLPNQQIVEALTAGVTYDLKKMIYTRNPQTPEEWLDYVNTIQKRPVTRGQPTPQRGLDRWQPESTPPPSRDPFKVPTLHIQPVQIKPNTDRVIRLRPYRIPFTYRKEIDIQINEMLKNNIIEPAIGEYASPITLVKKKNGTFRMCVDFRKFNEHIPVDPQPIPLIESVIEKLSKAKYFSSLDLSNAYWTVPIHPDSRPYLAFTTHAGVYMFKRLPFGLRSSPQIFERAIGQILRKYNFQFLEHYYDDFIIFSDSFEEHLEHLRLFFQLCRAENIRLNLNKCQLCKTSISFLGYEITQGTYKPHLTNTQVIGTIQPPTNVKTLQSFLGVVNVYHKFIPHYAQLRSPLNILLKKNIPFKWTLECQKAFEDLKSSLTASPVLHIFKEDLPCFLYCDASTLGISGILKQKDENGEEHPVQYFSRSLRKYEQNYSISELECLAIIESIEYFRVYLLGRHFTIYSDHQALVYLKNIKNPSEAQQLEEHQHRVPEKYQSLINTDGLAIITKKGVPRVVVPDTLRNKLLQKAHEWYNHPGITQLTRLITSQYYWDGMTKDINNYVRKCKICQIIKPPKGPSYGEMGTLPLAKEPYELMSMDTVAGFTKYGGNRAYLHKVLNSQGIKPLYTTANHPQSNGLSERLNATITGKLKILHLEHPKQTWTKQIERVTRIYNLTPHTVTGFPPIYLLKGIVPNNLNNHVQTFPELSEARRIALQKTQARHKAEKLMYDQKHKKIDFVPGDLVLVKVYRHPNTPKLEPNYTGPYEILEILSPQVVRINRPNRPLQLQTEIINIEKLRRYVENIPHITPPTDLPDSPPRQNYFLFPYRHFTTDILGDPGSSRPRKWFQPFNHLDNSIFTDEKFYKPDFPITSKPTFSSIVKPTKSSTLVLDPKINPFDNMVE
ncbi:K02A2.6-like, partial [Cordylochernes scorpioides]